jgi:glutamate dehydrogenase
VRGVLGDVQRVVACEDELGRRLEHLEQVAREQAAHHEQEEIDEVVAFLHWLAEGAFVFLGYREDEVVDGTLRPVPGSGVGLLHDAAGPRRPGPPAGAELLCVDKTRRRSTVKRRARMDAIGVRRHGPDGEVVGESMLVGLFTSRAYAEPASQTPILHRKLKRILAAEDLIDGSHDFKAAVALYESFPKDELFAADTEDLRRAITALLALQGDESRLLGRRSTDGRTVSLIAAIPRASHTAALVRRMRALLEERFPSAAIEIDEALVEGERAQIHYTLHATEEDLPTSRSASCSARSSSWRAPGTTGCASISSRPRRGAGADARGALGAPAARVLQGRRRSGARGIRPRALPGAPDERRVLHRRPPAGARRRRDPAHPRRALQGGQQARALARHADPRGPRAPGHRGDPDAPDHGHGPGDVAPGLRRPRTGRAPARSRGRRPRIADAIRAVWAGDAESDVLNQLVVTAGLDWRQVGILRAYRKYRQRIGSRFTEGYQNEVILGNPELTAQLMALFEERFHPARDGGEEGARALRERIGEMLDAVVSLDHDRVLRNQLGLIEATVRTNAYKPGREALAFKVRSADVPAMPQPAPLYEIFVYSPEVEGVHLRGGWIARGGLRWSDRMDYRTEVFGLMRAQMTKNAVIVPDGAKGGFYLRRRPDDPAQLRRQVERAYVAFISGLLDLTDNRDGDRVVHPPGVRVRDDDDAYLVVAADKGTATFSDLANSVSASYEFWLGDAFASGGSAGYDHKALGITARGAWESLKRHFRESGRDPERDNFTVVGIGDMSGDVFGNGMLLSRTLKLVAAYDHRHVFIDPDPDPARSWEERKRLFELAGSSWADYDVSLLSEGGGVFPRTAKKVRLPEPARRALGIEEEVLAPNELISAILRAPVDVLWNGGIGTVVKASTESHDDAQDRGSDSIRVDADELRCGIVAEGGNLGLTQRARIEYARGGGRVNADFVDNSAGVNCSDHEVNLKVLLARAVQRGELTVPSATSSCAR